MKLPTDKSLWIPQAVASLMLLVALYPENPYGYYVLLRWVVCGVFAYLAYRAYGMQKNQWVWVLGITAAVYNPFIQMHFGREIWSFLNITAVIIACISIRFLSKGQ